MDSQDRERCQGDRYLLKVWNLNHASFPKTRIHHTKIWPVDCSPNAQVFVTAELPKSKLLRISLSRAESFCLLSLPYEGSRSYKLKLWESSNLQELKTWDVEGHCRTRFSGDGRLLATTSQSASEFWRRMRITVMCTISQELRATFWVDIMEYHAWNPVELEFLNGDRQLLYGSRFECCIWDIETGGCLFMFDISKTEPDIILPYPCPWFFGEEDIVEIQLNGTDDIRTIVRVSRHITVETITASWLASFQAVDGQATFLEVRDDTLWEFDRLTERPLCWLPISWRRLFEGGFVFCSGSFLIFGLPQGDIGVLNMESLRRACTRVRRPRAADSRCTRP